VKYLSGKSILALASQLVGKIDAQELMTSLSFHSAESYAEAWGKYLGDRLGKQVTVVFSCDKWHIAIRS
jgi:hypothetical protein